MLSDYRINKSKLRHIFKGLNKRKVPEPVGFYWCP